MVYDYVLTIGDEVALVWKNRMSSSSWIFFAARSMLVCNVIDLATHTVNTEVRTLHVPAEYVAKLIAHLDASPYLESDGHSPNFDLIDV